MTAELGLSAELAPLWRALHARLSSGLPVSSVRVGPLDEDARVALADLLGLARLPGDRVSVPVSQLDVVLRDAVGLDARGVAECLVGPVGDQAADRRRAAAERDRLWQWLVQHPVVASRPALLRWSSPGRGLSLGVGAS